MLWNWGTKRSKQLAKRREKMTWRQSHQKRLTWCARTCPISHQAWVSMTKRSFTDSKRSSIDKTMITQWSRNSILMISEAIQTPQLSTMPTSPPSTSSQRVVWPIQHKLRQIFNKYSSRIRSKSPSWRIKAPTYMIFSYWPSEFGTSVHGGAMAVDLFHETKVDQEPCQV